MTLHVRSHQSAVCVIVFQERNQCRRNGNQLSGRNVNQRDFFGRTKDELAVFTASNQLVFDKAVFAVQFRVCLSDDFFAFFHGGQINNRRFFFALFIFAIADDLSVFNLEIRAFDKAVLIDTSVGRQRVNQADVRTFGRFNRADTAVMRRMNVSNFKACAVARQAAGAQSGQTAFMRNFRQRVVLIHKLRQLGRAEEFTNGDSRGFGVNQIMRHNRVDVDRAHPFANRAFHAQQTDAVLVFH